MAARRSVFDRMGPTGRNGDRVRDETLNAKVGPPVRNNGIRNYAEVLRGGTQGTVQEKELGSKPVIVLDQECHTVLNEKVDVEGKDDCFMNNEGDYLVKDGRSEDDDDESVHVPDSFANENREGVKTPLDDPFGLDDLICKKGDVNNCCSKERANDNSFPPGFTSLFVAREGVDEVECQQMPTQHHSSHAVPCPVNFSRLSDLRSRQAIASDDEQECRVRRVASWQDLVGGVRTKPHIPIFGTQSANADSMIPPKPPVDAMSLMDQFNRFQRIFALEDCKEVTVFDKLAQDGWVTTFRRLPRGGVESLQWDELVDVVNEVVLINSQDRWRWAKEGSGCFSVASAREAIDAVCFPSGDSVVKWCSLALIKLNVLAWKIVVNELPTRWNLARRRLDIPSIACVVCEKGGESIDHLFFGCSFVTDLVTGVAKWWGINIPFVASHADW
ncbi:hypothetical protein L1887_34236 [Cichorium endivia]|nr:hypothetical protein L1887_34236 [Cichorium endivia]